MLMQQQHAKVLLEQLLLQLLRAGLSSGVVTNGCPHMLGAYSAQQRICASSQDQTAFFCYTTPGHSIKRAVLRQLQLTKCDVYVTTTMHSGPDPTRRHVASFRSSKSHMELVRNLELCWNAWCSVAVFRRYFKSICEREKDCRSVHSALIKPKSAYISCLMANDVPEPGVSTWTCSAFSTVATMNVVQASPCITPSPFPSPPPFPPHLKDASV